MKTLVLGGTRFIGYHLVQALLAGGHEVTVLNRGRSPDDLPEGVRRLRGDRDDAGSMRAALQDDSYDAVLDVSGYTGRHVETVLEAAGERLGHYVFCSSTAVYFGSPFYPIAEDAAFMPEGQGGEYAQGKIAGERALAEWARRTGHPYTAIRPTYVYGPRTYTPNREPSFFYRLEQGRPLLMPSGGIPLVHMVHVEDVAQMFVRCLGNLRSHNQAYNCAGPDMASIRGWYTAMAGAVGVPLRTVRIPEDLANRVTGRVFPYEFRRNVAYTIEKAVRDLGYRPAYTTTTGHVDAYRWYRAEAAASFTWDLSEDDALLEAIEARGR